MNVKLLLDENLSPSIAVALCADGIDAVHVRDRGMSSARDAEVLERAFAEDRVLVTVNVRDFERLASRLEVHAGIVLIEDGDLLRAEQEAIVRDAFGAMHARVALGGDMVNQVLRIGRSRTSTFDVLASQAEDPEKT